MKILNLYAGIGGNRKLWGDEHEVTAVEYDENIAKIYSDYFPNDKMLVEDAHEYLLKHYMEYDFIWSSPPCPTHSKLRIMREEKIYADMGLYQEILFLKSWFKGKYVVENVIPYYKPIINPTHTLHRHLLWTNVDIVNKSFENLQTCTVEKEREYLEEKYGYDLSNYYRIDKRKVLRNCVVPEMGKHILDCAINQEQIKMF